MPTPSSAEGSDIYNAQDGFNFAWEQKSGDFDVVVRQKDIRHTSNWSKGGLMVREDLTPASRNWNIVNDPLASDGIAAPDLSGYGASAVECNCRSTNDVATDSTWLTDTNSASPDYPDAWVRIKRTGNGLNAFSSQDGVNWTQLAYDNPTNYATMTALPNTVYVGICTTAHNNDPAGTAFSALQYLNVVDYDNYNSSYVPTVPIGGAVKMAITRSGSNLTISWTPGGGTLQSSPALGSSANWQPVAGATNPMTIPISSGVVFYRVK